MDSAPEPVEVVTYLRVIDGERWWCCPVAGPDCCRVSAAIGEWAADAILWHVANHHRSWS